MLENRVGIVIPSFNSGTMVVEAAHSALACLGGTTNLVIVDDGTTDRRSLVALDGLRQEGFTVHRQKNAGVSAARNRGLGALSTPYAFALDSDDLIQPGAAGVAADVLDARPEVVIVAGSGINFAGQGEEQASPPISPGKLTRKDIWRSNQIATASAFRLEDWARCGGFPEDVAIGEDWVFWLRLLRNGGSIATSEHVFLRHRIHDGQTTRQSIDPRESAKAANLALRENPELALENADELIEELCRSRETLAAYRHAYRFPDRAKSLAKDLNRIVSRSHPAR